MLLRTGLPIFILCWSLQATIIDRVAIVVNNQVIKDSDIERDLRVVDFLNQEKLVVDQVLISREIQVGEYQTPSSSDADKLFQQIDKERFANQAALLKALGRYGLTEDQLKQYLLWQLTVLRRIQPQGFDVPQQSNPLIEPCLRPADLFGVRRQIEKNSTP